MSQTQDNLLPPMQSLTAPSPPPLAFPATRTSPALQPPNYPCAMMPFKTLQELRTRTYKLRLDAATTYCQEALSWWTDSSKKGEA